MYGFRSVLYSQNEYQSSLEHPLVAVNGAECIQEGLNVVHAPLPVGQVCVRAELLEVVDLQPKKWNLVLYHL